MQTNLNKHKVRFVSTSGMNILLSLDENVIQKCSLSKAQPSQYIALNTHYVVHASSEHVSSMSIE